MRTLPIDLPSKVIAVGLNYLDHAAESSTPPPETPILFTKWPSCLIPSGEAIVIPDGIDEVDWEAELAVVIARTCRDVAADDALDFVAGYIALNDVSARRVQRTEGQWSRAKSFDTFGPIGPRLVPAAEIADPQALAIRCRVNGKVMQDSNTSQMIFSVADLIADISSGHDAAGGRSHHDRHTPRRRRVPRGARVPAARRHGRGRDRGHRDARQPRAERHVTSGDDVAVITGAASASAARPRCARPPPGAAWWWWTATATGWSAPRPRSRAANAGAPRWSWIWPPERTPPRPCWTASERHPSGCWSTARGSASPPRPRTRRRAMGTDARRQPVGHVLHVPRVPAGDAGGRARGDREHRLAGRARRPAQPRGVLRVQGRRRRPDPRDRRGPCRGRIRINAVCPGTVDSPWIDRILADDPIRPRPASGWSSGNSTVAWAPRRRWRSGSRSSPRTPAGS